MWLLFKYDVIVESHKNWLGIAKTVSNFPGAAALDLCSVLRVNSNDHNFWYVAAFCYWPTKSRVFFNLRSRKFSLWGGTVVQKKHLSEIFASLCSTGLLTLSLILICWCSMLQTTVGCRVLRLIAEGSEHFALRFCVRATKLALYCIYIKVALCDEYTKIIWTALWSFRFIIL